MPRVFAVSGAPAVYASFRWVSSGFYLRVPRGAVVGITSSHAAACDNRQLLGLPRFGRSRGGVAASVGVAGGARGRGG